MECANCKRLEESKLLLVRNTALELERLRQFITLLSAALQGQGYTQRDIQRIENGLKIGAHSSHRAHNNNNNNNKDKKNKNSHHHPPPSSSSSSQHHDKTKKGTSNTPTTTSAGSHLKNDPKTKPLSREPQRLERKQSLEMLDQMLNNNNFHLELEPKNKDEDSAVEVIPTVVKSTAKKNATLSSPLSPLPVTSSPASASASSPSPASSKVQSSANATVTAEKSTTATTTAAATTTTTTTTTATATTTSSNMSVRERMAALKQNMSAVDENQEKKVNDLKRERGFQQVEASADKANIANLFEQRLKKQKDGGGALTIELKDSANDGTGTGTGTGVSLKEILKNSEVKGTEAQQVMTSLNIFQPMEKKPDLSANKDDTVASQTPTNEQSASNASVEKLEMLNMNNSTIMNKMSETEKEHMEALICNGIVNNKDLKVVQMCNANVDDKFFIKILDTLSQNTTSVNELWFENNHIGDAGMQRLGQFIRSNQQITVMKFYSNKKTISTPVLDELCNAIMENQTLIKFVFDGFRFQQQKDKLDKALKRNHAIARQQKKKT